AIGSVRERPSSFRSMWIVRSVGGGTATAYNRLQKAKRASASRRSMGTRSIAVGVTGAQLGTAPGEIVARALDWAAERAGEAGGRSGEAYLDHARATIGILRELGVDEPVLAAAALISPAERLPLRDIEAGFGSEVARLVDGMRQIQRLRELHSTPGAAAGQVETLRRMLLAMATDIRVVLLRLASRLHTLRYHAA